MHNYMLADIARILKKRSVRFGIPGFALCLALLLLCYGGKGAVSADMRRAAEFRSTFSRWLSGRCSLSLSMRTTLSVGPCRLQSAQVSREKV